MQIIDSIHSIFDKKYNSCKRCHCDWIITENSEDATFNKLIVHKEGVDFTVLLNDFYKGLSAITHDRSSFLCDSDCDGIALIEEKDHSILFFVDLKSSFKESNIRKAFEQDFFSFLKIHMMLSLCEDYQLDRTKLVFYAACPPCKTQSEEDSIKDNLLMSKTINDVRFIDNCFLSFFYGANGFKCKIGDLPIIKNIILRHDILSTNIVFRIHTPKNITDNESTIYL
jgi:hypothetical protein